jgi:tetratricopeptide (TPR) repeat protein
MELVRADAEAAGDVTIQSRALAALAEVALTRDADVPRARSLAERALAILDDEPSLARYDALDALSTAAWWVGRLREAERLTREQVEIAQALGRKELEGGAIDGLASLYLERLEYEKARELIERANELAEESGSLRYQAWARRGRARLHILLGELDEAQAALEEARDLFEEAGASTHNARTLMVLADVAARRGEFSQAEHLLRDAVKILKPLGERGTLCEVQRRLAQALVKLGKVEEAERVALQARETVGPQDRASRATTRMALGLVRVAQGRDEEAETLLRDAVSLLDDTDFRHALIEPLEALVQFLRERERDDEAAPFERRLLELAPAAGLAASFGASAARIA